MILRAMTYAKTAHRGQVRKYTDEAYISHPFAVAGLVLSVTDDSEMIAASLLHDVVEDTDATIEHIFNGFGQRVSELVENLTDPSMPMDGNRAARRAIDREHTAGANPDAKTIKLADLIDNTRTIVALDPKFAKVYMAEKKLLLDVLKEGDSSLYKIAETLVHNYYKENL